MRYLLIIGVFYVEIRKYNSYFTASVSLESEEDLESKGFRILADYIFGNNISMTAPVFRRNEVLFEVR